MHEMNMADAKAPKEAAPNAGVQSPPSDCGETVEVVKRKLSGWWLKKISKTSEKTNMPMISATTTMLLIIATNLTPAMLMSVPTTIATRAMKTLLGIPRMVGGIPVKMASKGIGTVNATAVMVRMPAKNDIQPVNEPEVGADRRWVHWEA